MRFRVVLSLTLALCLLSLFSDGFVHHIYPDWLKTGASLGDLMQLLSVAKSTFLSWLGITRLHNPYGLTGMDVAPEDQSSFAECPSAMCLPDHETCDSVWMEFAQDPKQAPVTTELVFAERPQSLPNLATYDNVGMDFAPEDPKQAPVAFEIIFAERPTSIVFADPETRDNVVPEDLQQAPVAAESGVTIPPGSIALRSPPAWTSTLTNIIPEGLRRFAVITKNMTSNLPSHLSHLWDRLVQVDRAQLLRRTLWLVGPPSVTHMAIRFWRHLQAPREW